MVELRDEGGAVALGRVLTLIIDATKGDAEAAITAANNASREHPCRVIAVTSGASGDENRLDAEVRIGGDAGASEVLKLDRKSTRLNSSHVASSYAVFCLKKKIRYRES